MSSLQMIRVLSFSEWWKREMESPRKTRKVHITRQRDDILIETVIEYIMQGVCLFLAVDFHDKSDLRIGKYFIMLFPGKDVLAASFDAVRYLEQYCWNTISFLFPLSHLPFMSSCIVLLFLCALKVVHVAVKNILDILRVSLKATQIGLFFHLLMNPWRL